MKVGFYQFDVAYKNVEANLNKVKELLSRAEADLIVLPELCFSGYYFQTKEELNKYSDVTIQSMIINELHKIAKSKNLFIVTGLAEKDEDKIYNAAFLIGPEGLIGKHRKVNLTINEKVFDRGKDFAIFEIEHSEFGKVKIGILICFESWFPESYRILKKKSAQIICCPSNFGGPWTLDVMKVRSLENKVFTIMTNRTGKEMIENEEAEFRGESQIIDEGGNVLAKAKNDECIITFDIDPNKAVLKDNIICDDMNYEMSLYEEYVEYKNIL